MGRARRLRRRDGRTRGRPAGVRVKLTAICSCRCRTLRDGFRVNRIVDGSGHTVASNRIDAIVFRDCNCANLDGSQGVVVVIVVIVISVDDVIVDIGKRRSGAAHAISIDRRTVDRRRRRGARQGLLLCADGLSLNKRRRSARQGLLLCADRRGPLRVEDTRRRHSGSARAEASSAGGGGGSIRNGCGGDESAIDAVAILERVAHECSRLRRQKKGRRGGSRRGSSSGGGSAWAEGRAAAVIIRCTVCCCCN